MVSNSDMSKDLNQVMLHTYQHVMSVISNIQKLCHFQKFYTFSILTMCKDIGLGKKANDLQTTLEKNTNDLQTTVDQP